MLWAGISAQSRGEVMYRITMLRLRVATPRSRNCTSRSRSCTSRSRSWVARFQVGLLLAGLGLVTNACVFDSGGVQGYWPSDQGVDHAPPKPDVAPDIALDILAPDTQPPCGGKSCPLGCNTEEDRCNRMRPSNIDPEANDVDYDEAVTAIMLNASPEAPIIINADTGEIPGFTDSPDKAVREGISHVVLPQVDTNGTTIPNAPEVAVFVFDALQITPGTVVRVVGSYPVIFYVRTTVQIDGTLLVNGSSTAPGPSGGGGGGNPEMAASYGSCGESGEKGVHKDSFPAEWTSGGGGGGHGTEGAPGAKVKCSTDWAPEGAAGGILGTPSLIPLHGGCGGGAGGGPVAGGYQGGNGGSGGGALQISAGTSLVIGTNGHINAGGSGGRGGESGAAGGGGGAGGAILLEAPLLKIEGLIAANGGGGGAGSESAISGNGDDGDDGASSIAPPSGGSAGLLSFGTNGGNGGAGTTQPTSGQDSELRCNGGGGGGGAGRIRLNATSATIKVTPSPTPSTNDDPLLYW